MRRTHILLGLLSCLTSSAQSIFQNTYGDHHFGPQSFAASPDAYYLAHENEILKVDLDGQLLWRREIMFGTIEANIYRLAYLDDALLVSGGHAAQQNYFMKLDTSGAILWSNAVNYGDINLPIRIHDASGGYLMAGHRDILDGGDFTFDITMSRWDAAGDFLWGKATGDGNYHYFGWTSLVLSNGDILVAGNREHIFTDESHPLIARFDQNGDPLWMKILVDGTGFFTHLIPADLIATSDGEFALVGTTYNTFFNYDAHVMKIDGDGNVLWAKRIFQISWTESAHAVIEDSQQRLVVGGAHNLSSDPVEGHLARFDLSGNFIDVLSLPRFESPTGGGYYSGLGQDLVERVGSGYAYAGDCDTLSFGPGWQGIITTGYAPGTTCYGVVDPYPFTVNSYTWADSLIANPGTTPAFTEVAATLTSTVIPGSSFDVCSVPLALGGEAPTPFLFTVFPNPTDGRFTCTWSMDGAAPTSITLLDATGRNVRVLFTGNGSPGRHQETFDLSGLSPGMYLLRAAFEGAVVTRRLNKE